MAYTRTHDEVRHALDNQVKALDASCREFDAGELWEGARIASALHMLLYDSGSTRSILQQLEVKHSIPFVCSGAAVDPRNLIASHPLVMLAGGPEGPRYAPLIEQPPFPIRDFKFKKWWREPVFASPTSKWELSREELVRNMRNQDGGGHFDGTLSDDKYVEFSRSPIWVVDLANGEQAGLKGLEMNTIRQVGWEVLETLRRAGLVR